MTDWRSHTKTLMEAAEKDIRFQQGEFRIAGTDKLVKLLDLPGRLAHWPGHPEHLPSTLNNVAKFVSLAMSFPNNCYVRHLKTEYGAVHHGMYAFVAIDQLGYMQITCKTAKHIALLSGPGLYFRQPLDHVSQSLLSGIIKVKVHAHSNVMRGSNSPRKVQRLLMQNETKASL